MWPYTSSWLRPRGTDCENSTRLDPWVREDTLDKEMASHSTILAPEIPRTEKPGGLQSVGSQRVRHDLVTEDALAHTHTRSMEVK